MRGILGSEITAPWGQHSGGRARVSVGADTTGHPHVHHLIINGLNLQLGCREQGDRPSGLAGKRCENGRHAGGRTSAYQGIYRGQALTSRQG
jgi:hypothetical protein